MGFIATGVADGLFADDALGAAFFAVAFFAVAICSWFTSGLMESDTAFDEGAAILGVARERLAWSQTWPRRRHQPTEKKDTSLTSTFTEVIAANSVRFFPRFGQRRARRHEGLPAAMLVKTCRTQYGGSTAPTYRARCPGFCSRRQTQALCDEAPFKSAEDRADAV